MQIINTNLDITKNFLCGGYGMRPEIEKIYIDENVAVATDSYKLIEIPHDKKSDKPFKLLQDFDKEINVISTENEITNNANLYPDYKQIMPKKENGKTIRVNAKFLKDICNAYVAFYKKSNKINKDICPINITFYGDKDPILFDNQLGDKEIKALLMPIQQ